MRTIGLTGGIGSGKTTVGGMLRALGARVIDADRIGHESYLPATIGWSNVVAEFGNSIVAADGSIDRKQLGSIVFSDAEKLSRLNAIVHPLIGDAIRKRIAELQSADDTTPIVVEAAVLIEAGWQTLIDEVWLVVAKPAAVLERLATQRGLDALSVEARIRAQLSDEARRRHAHVVIENNGTIDDLRQVVETLWRERAGV